jgi:hypothetical protein
MCTVYVRSDSLAAVLVSDQEYPDRVSFTLLHKVKRAWQKSIRKLYGIDLTAYHDLGRHGPRGWSFRFIFAFARCWTTLPARFLPLSGQVGRLR